MYKQRKRTLNFKKNKTKPWLKKMWCIPKITPEYRARMYDILDLYMEQYDYRYPVIGVDEKPKQLLGDKREPISMKPGKVERYDYEYSRNGTANIFVGVEPKHGKRITKVTQRRTKKDFAKYMKEVVLAYPYAEKIRVVLDNLNTHSKSAFFETFEYEVAEKILSKLEFHYTPKHASWLNVAEIEIAAIDAECTKRRIGDISLLRSEVAACTKSRNIQKKRINWRFTKQKADEKLSKYYICTVKKFGT